MTLRIEPVQSRSDLLAFIKFPWTIYRKDPAWVPPLIKERLDFLNPKKNPFYEHAEVQLFLARQDGTHRNGEIVGRISTQIDHHFNEVHREKTGFFGFFESADDPEVAGALLEKAKEWHQSRGMNCIRGPFCFSVLDECGILVEGQDQSPYILTAHTPPYYPKLLETIGYRKAKDLYCWRYDSRHEIAEGPRQIAEEVRKHPGLKIREIDMRHLERDVRTIMEIYNSAWSQNWGFVPLTDAEVRKAAKDFKRIVDPRLVLIAEVNGDPAAFSLALPNINEAIRDLNGRLFPFGLPKLLYRLKFGKIKSARLIALGIKKEYRGSVLGGLSVLLYVENHLRSQLLGHWGGELSWTLEDNEKINMGIGFMGGERYKTYRIYEKMI